MTRVIPARPDDRGESLAGMLVLLVSLVATAVVAGLIMAGLAMPAVGAAGASARAGVGFFESLPAELKQDTLAQQSRILAADGSLIATFYSENRIVVPLTQVSPNMAKAQVAIEDSRFYEHGGVDLRGIVRAAVNNATTDSLQGASTLTQQYVKLTLQENAVYAGDKAGVRAAGEQTKSRKIRELKLAVTLEEKLSKDKILEGYLNIANYGDGAYGVEAASRHYFGLHAKALSLPQAALLAGIVKSPRDFNPRTNLKPANSRRNLVLGRMLATGVITAAQHDKAVKTRIVLKISPTGNGCDVSRYGYFCNYVYRTLLADKNFGATANERRQQILRGGLTITTTLDPDLQAMAQKAVNDRVPASNKSKVGAALSVVEPGTGKVLAMAQNTKFSNKTGAGFTAVNYNVDKAYGGGSGFLTGSTFKAFTLAAALKEGRPLSSRIQAPVSPATYYRNDFKYCSADRSFAAPVYKVFNSEGGEHGNLTLTEATAKSVNTAFVTLAAEVGVCEVRDMAERLGVHLASPLPYGDGPASTRLRPFESLTLGTETIAPLTMATAYAAFAAGGVYCAPISITAVKGLDGKPRAAPKTSCQQAIDADIASGVTKALQAVLTEGTGRGLGLGRPAAGKTGTTNGSTDVWFAGYTPQLSVAVWVGHPGAQKTLNRMSLGGRKYGIVYGATISGPIWNAFMSQAVADLPVEQFDSPSDTVINGERLGVPSVYGMDQQSAQDEIRAAGLRPSVSGRLIASSQPAGVVVGSSPRSGVRVPRGTRVIVYLSSGVAPAPDPAPQPAPSATQPPADTGPVIPITPADDSGGGNGNGKKPR